MVSTSEVLAIKELWALRRLEVGDFVGRDLSYEEVTHVLNLCNALWFHSGDPKDPHAELTAGDCSNGFVDVLRALRYSNLCQIFAAQAVRRYQRSLLQFPDWVVGSDHAGADFSHSVGIMFNTQHDFTEKGPNKTQQWNRFVIMPDEVVLQAEELMMTSGTLLAVRQGIRDAHQYPVTFTPPLVLVHRSDVYEIDGDEVLFVIHYDIQVWKPEECPLCKAGSKRLRPKQNWAELTGRR